MLVFKKICIFILFDMSEMILSNPILILFATTQNRFFKFHPLPSNI